MVVGSPELGLRAYGEAGSEIKFLVIRKNIQHDMSLSWFGRKAKGTPAARKGFMGRNSMLNMMKSRNGGLNARGRRRARRFGKQ